MRASGYPDTAKHIQEHNRLTAKVAALERQFELGEATVGEDTMEFLRRWLHHHILGTDQHVTRHLGE